MTFTQPDRAPSSKAPGPLVVSDVNPRYFTVRSEAGDGSAVYLTGSHINNNFQDGMGAGEACAEKAEPFDYEAYLTILTDHGHNFIRLWRWEQFKGLLAPVNVHFCMTPQPWPRSGPGEATDGKPKFDLSVFDATYFDRLRERVLSAGNRGIYVSVMLFDGFSIHLTSAPGNVEGHPFHAANNVNGIAVGSITDYQVLPLDPAVQALQEAYVRKVIDTVHDLPNVLYEVANESSGGGPVDPAFAKALGLDNPPDWGDSTDWQYWVIDLVRRHEDEQGYDAHPIGMTLQFPVADQAKVNEPLFQSAANWISPGFEETDISPGDPKSPAPRWLEDPSPNDGRKVVLSDTDHYAPGKGDARWAWKSFTRGHNPILYDYGIMGFEIPPDPATGNPGSPPFEAFEPARYAMGDTRRYAEKARLLEMEPRGNLSSTGYALANPGQEYIVLQPDETAKTFTVELPAGDYDVEWYHLDTRETIEANKISVSIKNKVRFEAPFKPAGPSVLYLRKVRA